MGIPVLIEPIPGAGYRAETSTPFATSAEGATPDEAMQRLKRDIEQRLAAGARIVSLELPSLTHDWLPSAAMYSEDDPIVSEWLQVLNEQRQTPETDE